MRFQVPQYIEVEDKIFGPLTIKQFIYVAGGAGLAYVVWKAVPKFIALIIVPVIIALAVALAFLKVNNRSFVFYLESMVRYVFSGKLYVWRKIPGKKKKLPPAGAQKNPNLYVPSLSENKLKDLAWSLDVKERMREVEEKRRIQVEKGIKKEGEQ